MNVTILYFAVLRELTGIAEERVELPPSIGTIEALGVFLVSRHPSLAGRLSAVRFARNEVFTQHLAPICDGDVIALLPPVTGG